MSILFAYYFAENICYNSVMEKDELIISRINDWITKARNDYYAVASGFLDSHEQSVVKRIANSDASKGVTLTLYGGFEDAERRILVCTPEDWYTDDFSEYLNVLRIAVSSGSKVLTHRDYLGSILGLGIERSLIGDILVRNDGADIIISADIVDFLLREYTQVGRFDIKSELLPILELAIPEQRTVHIRDTVPSLRLDCVISSAFKVSRTNASTCIKQGLVSVNHAQQTKIDAKVDEGSTLVLKGKGKAILKEVGGESKKGRIWIDIEKFV